MSRFNNRGWNSRKRIAGGVVAWLVLSAVSIVWTYYEAQAAVKVRPALADVGVVDAFLTNHGFDWLFYHHPVVGAGVMAGVYGLVVGFFVWSQ